MLIVRIFVVSKPVESATLKVTFKYPTTTGGCAKSAMVILYLPVCASFELFMVRFAGSERKSKIISFVTVTPALISSCVSANATTGGDASSGLSKRAGSIIFSLSQPKTMKNNKDKSANLRKGLVTIIMNSP